MHRLSRLLAVVLLVLWLPATLHCNLEAAGLIAMQCEEDCTPGQSSSNDGCGVIENGLFKVAANPIKIAPEAFFLICMPCVRALELDPLPSSVLSPERFPAAQVLRRTWQFVQRAAPPCRAPSLIV